MARILEPIFSVVYLITVIALGVLMITKSRGDKNRCLFGIMAVILGCGDAFHLVPRIIGLLTDTMEENAAALGFGKLVTSITMTAFYLILYHFWSTRYGKPLKSKLTAAVYGLGLVRVVLCLFPQNDWLSADAPLSWGIYRNIPFAILGAVIVVLFFREAKKAHDKAFRFGWLAVPDLTDEYEFVRGGEEVLPNANYGVRVDGDSMEPDISDGYVVWVRAQSDLENGEIGIFKIDRERTCVKKLYRNGKKAELRSINPEYEPITEPFEILGKVLKWTEDIY